MTVNNWPGKKKIENSDNLSENFFFNFQESIAFDKMRKTENSGFNLINYHDN